MEVLIPHVLGWSGYAHSVGDLRLQKVPILQCCIKQTRERNDTACAHLLSLACVWSVPASEVSLVESTHAQKHTAAHSTS
jgi:hypothetical protein